MSCTNTGDADSLHPFFICIMASYPKKMKKNENFLYQNTFFRVFIYTGMYENKGRNSSSLTEPAFQINRPYSEKNNFFENIIFEVYG